MSSFARRTKNPVTKQFETAYWLDDYFGRHNYGVRFPSSGIVYRESACEWEFEDKPNDLKCIECGTNLADPPSLLCPGCEAYREHVR